MSRLANMVTGEEVEESVDELLIKRVGNITNIEVYSNYLNFLILFVNDYSMIIRKKKKVSKKVAVERAEMIGSRIRDLEPLSD